MRRVHHHGAAGLVGAVGGAGQPSAAQADRVDGSGEGWRWPVPASRPSGRELLGLGPAGRSAGLGVIAGPEAGYLARADGEARARDGRSTVDMFVATTPATNCARR